MFQISGSCRSGAVALICAFSAVAAVAGKPAKKPAPALQEQILLIYPPHEMGTVVMNKKSGWAAGLLCAAADFRIGFSIPVRVVSMAEIPELRKQEIRNGGSDGEAERIAKEISAAYILAQKFSLDKSRQVMTYRCEVRRADGGGIAFSAEATVPFESLGYGIDSCLLEIAKRLSPGSIPEEVGFFFKLPALSTSFKLNKRFGEAVFAELYGGAGGRENHGDRYRKFYEKDPSMLLCIYHCAGAALAGRRLDEAIGHYTSLVKVVPNKNRCRLPLARALCLNGQPRLALGYLNPVVCSGPVKGASETLGDALLQMGKRQPALDAYIRERDLHGELPSVQEKIASCFFDDKNFTDAETEYRRLAKADSGHAGAPYYESLCALSQGKVERAVALFMKAETSDRVEPRLYKQLGAGFAGVRRYEAALEAYRRSLTVATRDTSAWLESARIEERIGRDSAAAESYLSAYGYGGKKNASCLARAGDLFSGCGHQSKAANAYTEYLRHDRTDVHAAMGLARIMVSRKNHGNVITLLESHARSPASTNEMLRMLSESYFETGRYAAATPLLSSLVARERGDPRLIAITAIAYEKQGVLAKAAEMYELYLTLPPSAGHPDFAFHAGMLYERIQQTRSAIARYEDNMKKYPEDPRNYNRCGRLYGVKGDWELARKYLEIALEFPKPDPELKKLLAQTYCALDKKNDAIRMYRSYVSLVPEDAGAQLALGTLWFDQRHYDRAVNPLKKAAAKQPKSFECWYMLGVSYVHKADHEAGREALSRAHDLNPTHVSTIELLATCHRTLKRNGDLAATLKKWAALEPKRSDIHIERGILYLEKGKSGEAIVALTEAVRQRPLDARPHKLLARCYGKLGDERMRLFHLKEANRFAPEDWDTYSELGFYYLAKGEHGEAERCLEKAIALNPGYTRAIFELGSILIDRNDTIKAYALLKRAADMERGNPLYLAQFGRAAGLTGDSSRAYAAILEALKKENGDCRVLLYSGYAYDNLGDRAAAEKLYLNALARDGGCIPCKVALGDLYRETARYKQAAAAYLEAWENGGYREDVAFKLGVTLSLSEKYDQAKDFLETILAKNQEHDEARYLLVTALCEIGDIKKARETAAVFYGKDAVLAQLGRGRIHEKTRNWDAAVMTYQAVGHLSPGNPLALQGMARIHAARGWLDSAIQLYSKARRNDSLDMRLVMETGALHEKLGKTDSALSCYYEVGRKFPDHPRVHVEIARVRSLRGEHVAAIAALRRDIGLHPRESRLYFLLAREFERIEDYKSAIEAYEQAIKNGTDKEIDAFRLIGNIYRQKLIDEKKAKKYYARYIKAGGRNSDALAFMKARE